MPYYFCCFSHNENPDYVHHMVVQSETEQKARMDRAQFERAFKLDVNNYDLESYEIKDSVFIFD